MCKVLTVQLRRRAHCRKLVQGDPPSVLTDSDHILRLVGASARDFVFLFTVDPLDWEPHDARPGVPLDVLHGRRRHVLCLYHIDELQLIVAAVDHDIHAVRGPIEVQKRSLKRQIDQYLFPEFLPLHFPDFQVARVCVCSERHLASVRREFDVLDPHHVIP